MDDFWLCNIKGIGKASIRKLIGKAGSAEAVRRLSDQEAEVLLGKQKADCLKKGLDEKREKNVRQAYERMREKGIGFWPFWGREYPARLQKIADAPSCLYVRGKGWEQEKKTVAIIGTRECSGYGREMAKYFAAGLAKDGAAVVSGMARGVDAIAQEAALAAGGSCAAVLGCGVDICYPPENRGLYDRLEKEGCLFSEYPPGTMPQAGLFPPRNRIISGLSDLVLVVEAREKSGTLITVDMALEQGRDVFAVPGRVTDACSRGCNILIGNGAGIARSVRQLSEELGVGFSPESGARQKKAQKKEASGYQEDGVLSVLDCDPKSADDILRDLRTQNGCTAATIEDLMQELALLCMEKKAYCRAGMYFRET